MSSPIRRTIDRVGWPRCRRARQAGGRRDDREQPEQVSPRATPRAARTRPGGKRPTARSAAGTRKPPRRCLGAMSAAEEPAEHAAERHPQIELGEVARARPRSENSVRCATSAERKKTATPAAARQHPLVVLGLRQLEQRKDDREPSCAGSSSDIGNRQRVLEGEHEGREGRSRAAAPTAAAPRRCRSRRAW